MWGDNFLQSLAKFFGVYVYADEATKMKSSMDVAHFSLKTKCFDKLSRFSMLLPMAFVSQS